MKFVARPGLLVAWFLLLAGHACGVFTPDRAINPTQPWERAISPSAAIDRPPSPAWTASASPAPTSTPMPHPSPLPAKPTISPHPTQRLSLTVASAARLVQVGQIAYSPWELILALAWSPDGRYIACAAGETIHLYTAGLEEQARIQTGYWTTSLAFNPESRLLAAAGKDGVIRIWDIQRGTLSLEIPAHKKGVNAVAFSPDGRYLASAGNDAIARIWDPNSGEQLTQMIGGTYAVPAIAFDNDGNALAIANGDVIRFRDVETGRFVKTYRSQEPNYSLAISPDGELLAAGGLSNNIHLWQLALNAKPVILAPLENSPSLVWSLSFSPDGNLLAAGGSDRLLRVWDVKRGTLLVSAASHLGTITSLAFSPDGCCLVSGGLDATLRLWAAR